MPDTKREVNGVLLRVYFLVDDLNFMTFHTLCCNDHQ